tara:strand:+ start:42 stop:380 length:339 start_codon:yes stop_codon:yes gene_type:complete
MPKYAELDENNVVIRVLTFADSDTPATVGLAGRWQISLEDTPAGLGYTFRETHPEFPNGAFIRTQPWPSWTLNETTLVWESPVAAPPDTGTNYYWNEKNGSWDLEPPEEEAE